MSRVSRTIQQRTQRTRIEWPLATQTVFPEVCRGIQIPSLFPNLYEPKPELKKKNYILAGDVTPMGFGFL